MVNAEPLRWTTAGRCALLAMERYIPISPRPTGNTASMCSRASLVPKSSLISNLVLSSFVADYQPNAPATWMSTAIKPSVLACNLARCSGARRCLILSVEPRPHTAGTP